MRLRLILSAVLVAVALSNVVHAKIHHSQVVIDDRKLIPLTDAFGFADGGKIDIKIKDVALYVKHDAEEDYRLENFGFFLSPVEADAALEQDLVDETKCILTETPYLFNFKDSAVQRLINKEVDNVTFHYIVGNGGLYFLYFANCEKATPVSFDVKVEMYNLDAYGNKDYLSVGETELETMFWVSCVQLLSYIYRTRPEPNTFCRSCFLCSLLSQLSGASMSTSASSMPTRSTI